MKTVIRPEAEMKTSGIEWVGLIPKDWKIAKNNRLFNISKKLVGSNWKNTQLLSLTKSGIIEKNINDGGGKQPESFETYQYVENNDVVLCLFDIDVSAVFSDRSKYSGMISPAYRVMKCTDAILSVYAKWWFDAVNIGRYYLIYTKSLRKTIDATGFGNILTAVPSLSEQQAIADYLDETCSKIDEIIAEAKASIDEYKELKQSVIFKAVTKGLDKNVEMKDSGVEWIGNTNKNAVIKKIKYTSNISRGLFNYRPRNAEFLYGGIHPFIQTGDVAKANKYVTDYKQTLSDEGTKISKFFPKGTLTMTIAANVGDVSILGFDAYFPDSVLGITPSNKYSSEYLYYVFSSMKSEFVRVSISNTQLNLNVERVKELFVPIFEDSVVQRKIVEYLDEKCSTIDSLIAEKESLINDLEAYKKSLIYEVVTGKRRVV